MEATKEHQKPKKQIVAHASGKRKTSLARATIVEGKGLIRVNSVLFENFSTKLNRLKIREVLALGEPYVDSNKINITISVSGGGLSGQTDAIRTSLSRALIEYASKDKKEALRDALVKYDRALVAGDSRRTEPHKPSKSSKGPRAKRQKSYR
ncbi:MAG: 30S ribosomal protein S9 [Candidatus Altiarchaeota archaeon]|nr:30S ribosomal protein S9 [Candidatus Altiarchaeota archaeon]